MLFLYYSILFKGKAYDKLFECHSSSVKCSFYLLLGTQVRQ